MPNLTTAIPQQVSAATPAERMQAAAAVIAKDVIRAYPSLLDAAHQNSDRLVAERSHGFNPAEEKSLRDVLNAKFFMPQDAQLADAMFDVIDDQLETASLILPSDDIAATTSWALQRVKQTLPSMPSNKATLASLSTFFDVCCETLKNNPSLTNSTNEYVANVRDGFLARMRDNVRKAINHTDTDLPGALVTSGLMVL